MSKKSEWRCRYLIVIALYRYPRATMSAVAINDIFIENPYSGHQELTTLEADVLWEYAKLAQNVKQVGIMYTPILMNFTCCS